MTALLLLHLVILAVLAALLAQTLLNARRLPRLGPGRPAGRSPRIAVLVPARNEAAGIAACVRAWAAQAYPAYEVVVYDDESTDGTAELAIGAAAGAPHVRVVRGGALPEGWRGKPHACDRLRAATGAELLIYADADVRPAPVTLAAVAEALARLRLDALSALPRHASPSRAVAALAALQNWAPLAFLPAWLPGVERRPLFAALNGQILAIRADVYDAAGGFAAVRLALGEDAALGRRLVGLGYRVRLVDGSALLACQPYRRVRELWRANVRNLLPVFFGSTPLLLLAVSGLGLLYLAPAALLLAGAMGGTWSAVWTWLPLAEIALGVASRAVSDRHAGYPPWLAALHPVAVAALAGMSLESAARFALGARIEWRGRRYAVTGRAD